MTNLKIGTILIGRKDSLFEITEGNKYPITKIDETYIYFIDDKGSEDFLSIHLVESNFIISYPLSDSIKRYTLTDLKEKKIAVRLKSRGEYEMLLKAVDCDYSSNYYEDAPYYGVNSEGFGYLYDTELPNYTLLESIDLIDLEEKEEMKEFKMEDFEEPIAQKAGDKRVLVNGFTLAVDFRIISEYNYQLLISEIARLKEENDRLTSDLNRMNMEAEIVANQYSGLLTDIAQLKLQLKEQSTPDLEKRERMAWELFLQSDRKISYKMAFTITDEFLAKSKEVGK